MDSVDLNCDLGEGFGQYRIGDDAAMLDIVSSVNIACGFHAGDPCIMADTVNKARQRGLAIGAHPSFRDLHGFGRREIKGIPASELRNLMIYQVGALQAIARSCDCAVGHVRTHGALANMSEADSEMATVVAQAIQAIDPTLALMSRPDSATDTVGTAMGLTVVRQAFADRAYNDDGSLVPRKQAGAVIHDADVAAAAVVCGGGRGRLARCAPLGGVAAPCCPRPLRLGSQEFRSAPQFRARRRGPSARHGPVRTH